MRVNNIEWKHPHRGGNSYYAGYDPSSWVSDDYELWLTTDDQYNTRWNLRKKGETRIEHFGNVRQAMLSLSTPAD